MKNKTPISAKEYVKSGNHLPDCLKDFHDQKDVFKWIFTKTNVKCEIDSTNAMIFVIDYFLWFMAQFGYTLQKSRANVEFRDLYKEIDDMNLKDIENFKRIFTNK